MRYTKQTERVETMENKMNDKKEQERISTEQMGDIITALVDASALNITNWMSAFTMAKKDAYRRNDLDRVRMADKGLTANAAMLEVLLPMQAVLHNGELEDIEQVHGEKKRYEKPSIRLIPKEELKAEVEKCIAKILGF